MIPTPDRRRVRSAVRNPDTYGVSGQFGHLHWDEFGRFGRFRTIRTFGVRRRKAAVAALLERYKRRVETCDLTCRTLLQRCLVKAGDSSGDEQEIVRINNALRYFARSRFAPYGREYGLSGHESCWIGNLQ